MGSSAPKYGYVLGRGMTIAELFAMSRVFTDALTAGCLFVFAVASGTGCVVHDHVHDQTQGHQYPHLDVVQVEEAEHHREEG